ncbi:MAG: SUKH-3 domain-containing protein [Blastocatellia bacterium]|nr:SUKH-3 domain-containing protein [Blastocatellia bacterium]
MKRFSDEVDRLLVKAGWFEGRDVLDQVRLLEGFTPFAAAQQVLREFGNLHIGSSGAGIDCARSDVEIDPSLIAGGEELIAEFENKLGIKLTPLGEAHNGHLIFLMDEQGRVFASWLFHDVFPYAKSFDRALETFLLGLDNEGV